MLVNLKTSTGHFVYINPDKVVTIGVVNNLPVIEMEQGKHVFVDENIADVVLKINMAFDFPQKENLKKGEGAVRVEATTQPSPS